MLERIVGYEGSSFLTPIVENCIGMLLRFDTYLNWSSMYAPLVPFLLETFNNSFPHIMSVYIYNDHTVCDIRYRLTSASNS